MTSKIEKLRLWLADEREAVSAVSTTAADNLTSLAEVIGMASMPMIPAALTGLSLVFTVAASPDNPDGWPLWSAILVGVLVIAGLESLGIASSKTAMRLYHAWRDGLSLQAEFFAVIVTVGFYVALVTIINLFSVALPGELRWIGAASAVLAVSMYVVVGFNSNLQRRRDETLAIRQAEQDLETEKARTDIEYKRQMLALKLEAKRNQEALKLKLKEESERAKLEAKHRGELETLSHEEALATAQRMLKDNPDISGAELGRAVGRSESWGRKVRAKTI